MICYPMTASGFGMRGGRLSRTHAGVFLLTVLASAWMNAPLDAQRPTETGRILGTVVDAETGQGVAGVSVRLILPPVERLVITGQDGGFVLDRVPVGIHELELSHIAYGQHTKLVNVPAGRTVELRVDLTPEALAVGEILVQVELRDLRLEKEGYYRRREFGFGYFFDADTFRRQSLSSVLHHVPGLWINPRNITGSLPYFRRVGRICVPGIWVNGRRYELRGASLEEMVPESEIVAMEVFRPGQTPGEYMWLGRDCGAIVVWLRR